MNFIMSISSDAILWWLTTNYIIFGCRRVNFAKIILVIKISKDDDFI